MSTGRWGDEPSDHQTPAETAPPAAATESGPPRRKKLALKPRGSTTTTTTTTTTSKSSIFGAAKPREEVLASKGIDAKLVDERITKKATAVHYTREQNEEIQALQAELTRAEADLRHANENELPEASFQKVVDAKRTELHDLMELYQKENNGGDAKAKEQSRSKQHQHYERPSERRKRLEAQQQQQQQQGMDGNRYDHHHEEEEEEPATAGHENAFEHFGGKQHHHRKSHSHSHRGDGHY